MIKKFLSAVALVLAAACALSFGGCKKQKEVLAPSGGIGNQAYLYGMCYNIFERNNSTTFDMEREVRLMANLGVTSVRLWMHVDDMLSSPDTVNEKNADMTHALIAELQKYGMQIIGMSHTSFHTGSMRSGKPARDISEGSYYIEWLNDYYLSWKTMAAEFPEVEYWEIDNEMNNADFMCSISGEKIYSQEQMAEIATDMLYYGSRGVLESNPDAVTVMGGLTEPYGLGSGQNKSFLQKLYDNIASGEFGYFYGIESAAEASSDPDDYFLAACWHPYIGSSDFNRENFVKFNNEIYQVILDNEKKHKKVFFTEMGFNDTTFGEEKSARFIEEMFAAIEEEMPYVEAVNYFKLYNVAATTWTGTVSRFGLFYDPDTSRLDYSPDDVTKVNTPGAPKEKAFAFQRAAGGSGSLELMKAEV